MVIGKTLYLGYPERSNQLSRNQDLSTALAKHHASGDTSMATEIVNLCPIM